MHLDFNRKCPDSDHQDEKFPLIGIEAEGSGIRYRYACGHGEIIQIVGAGAEKLLEISNQLRNLENKSLDELYKELAKSHDITSQVKTAKKKDLLKKGKLLFLGMKGDLQKILCEDFNLCKKLPYLQITIPQSSAVAIADILSTSTTGIPLGYLILVTSILMHIPLLELKKWCNC